MKIRSVVGLCVLCGLLALLAFSGLPGGGSPALAQEAGPGPTQEPLPDSSAPVSPDLNAESLPAAPEMVDAAAATTHYQHISGSIFVPLYDTAQAVYDVNGCKHLTGTQLYLTYPLDLPYNSTVTQLRLYFKDTSTSNGTLWLVRYDDGLANEYLVTLNTIGSTGWGTATTSVNIPLDYVNYSYTLIWAPGGVTNNTMQFCGYRVGYIPPSIFGTALPLVTK